MNPRIKDFIGVVAGLGVAVFAVVAWIFVDAYAKSIEPSSFRSFSVAGEGEVTAIPDVAQFTFSVTTEGGTNLASLQTQNVEKANQAIEYLKQQGVEDKDVQTQEYNVNPRYQSFSCPRPLAGEVKPCPPAEIVGYTITQTVQVKVRDFTKIGSIVSGVVDNGANSVSQLSFTIDERDAKESEARALAIEKAKEKAQAVAQAGGFRLGRLLSIQELGEPVYPLFKRALDEGFGEADLAPAPAATIEPGSQDVKVNVTLVYEIR